MGFKVQLRSCATCIYRKDSPLDLKALEAEVADDSKRFVVATIPAMRAVAVSGIGTRTSFKRDNSRND